MNEYAELLVKAKPVLKWAGGKAQLEEPILKAIDRIHPKIIQRYYEPFVGGGAIFFALARQGRILHAVLTDSNPELINFYLALKHKPERLILALKALKKKGFGKERYYEVRASALGSEATRAARFLYLNKCGFNGLWRVNKSGACNVPYGHHKKPPEICNEEALWAACHALQLAAIYVADYQQVCLDVRATASTDSAFVYLDSPYWPTRRTADFTSYTKDGFRKADQEQLAYSFRELARLKIPALLSNSDVPETRKLYKDFKKTKVMARRNINSVGTKRGAVSELLVESTFRK